MEEPDKPWKQLIATRLSQISSQVHSLQTKVEQVVPGREKEVIDRLQDIDNDISDLRQEIETSSWLGFATELGSNPRKAIVWIILVAVVALALYLLRLADIDPIGVWGAPEVFMLPSLWSAREKVNAVFQWQREPE